MLFSGIAGVSSVFSSTVSKTDEEGVKSPLEIMVNPRLQTINNGATYYVAGSLNLKNKPKRNLENYNFKSKNLKVKRLIMKAGTVCVMNTGIWHKAGESSKSSRWSIFSIYTGWFVKPYYDCRKLKNIKKVFKKLLHQYSTPPELSDKYKSTLTEYKHSK